LADDEWVLEDHWLELSKAPERFGVSRQTIYAWIRKGKVRTLRPGKNLWLSVQDLLKAEKESSARRIDKGG
jgi:excisionase family DNA binding protein